MKYSIREQWIKSAYCDFDYCQKRLFGSCFCHFWKNCDKITIICL